MSKSKIPWTERTWNPVVGCTKVSQGCANCYAEKMAARLASMKHDKYIQVMDRIDWLHWNGKIFCDESALDIPLKRKKPTKYFVCSMGDLFHPSVPFVFIEKVMAVIEECLQHTFQVLTKRPDIMLEYFSGLGKRFELSCCQNLWLLTSIENQKYADIRIPYILQTPAAVRGLSIEPMLGEIDITGFKPWYGTFEDNQRDKGISWVIIGCESNGSHLGRMGEFENWHLMKESMKDVVDQCHDAGVRVFVKQIPVYKNGKWRLEKKIENFPASLQYQEYPK